MMKNLLIIISGFCILLTLTLTFKSESVDGKYEETQMEIEEMESEKDSLFILADEVLDVVAHEQELNDSILHNLDEKVKNSEMTIEQQVVQLKKLLKDAEEANEFALEQRDIAEKMEKMSILQKQQAEMARMESEKRYHELLEENKNLLEEVDKLKKLTNGFDNMISDTLSGFDVLDDINIDEDIKKDKKRDKKRDKKKKKN